MTHKLNFMNAKFMLPRPHREIENQLGLIDFNRTEIESVYPHSLMLDESYDLHILGFDLFTKAVVYDFQPLLDDKWSYEDFESYDFDPFSDEWANAYDDQNDILRFELEELAEATGAAAVYPILSINTLIF